MYFIQSLIDLINPIAAPVCRQRVQLLRYNIVGLCLEDAITMQIQVKYETQIARLRITSRVHVHYAGTISCNVSAIICKVFTARSVM